MFRVTIRFGYSEAIRDFVSAPTAGQIKSDQSLRTELHYSDNVRLLMNGVQLRDDNQIPNGATVDIETAANNKSH